MLFTKCIYHPAEPGDGVRISVMSRHTQNDGKTPDELIQPVDVHIPSLGPSPSLIGEYYKRDPEMPWSEFEERFLAEIRASDKEPLLLIFAKMALIGDITFLCKEETARRCHRLLLANECVRLCPDLLVVHR